MGNNLMLMGCGSSGAGITTQIVLDTFSTPGSEPLAPDQGPTPTVSSGSGTVAAGVLKSGTSGTSLILGYVTGIVQPIMGCLVNHQASGLECAGVSFQTGYRLVLENNGVAPYMTLYAIGVTTPGSTG